MKTVELFRITLPLAAAAALASGCLNPLMFRKGAFAMDDWDTWTGWNDAYGSAEVRGNGLYYALTAKQDDTRDEPSDGYLPGLILSRELHGQRWRADLEAVFDLPPGQLKRFTYGIWVGGDSARPSVGNPSAAMKLIVQRTNGPRPSDDDFFLVLLPGGQPLRLPKELKVLRFEREGMFYTVFWSADRKVFNPVLRVDGTVAADAPSQKLFIGGFAGGDPAGARVRFKSIKINGREVLR